MTSRHCDVSAQKESIMSGIIDMLTPPPITDSFRAWKLPLCHKDTIAKAPFYKLAGVSNVMIQPIFISVPAHQSQCLNVNLGPRVLHSLYSTDTNLSMAFPLPAWQKASPASRKTAVSFISGLFCGYEGPEELERLL